MIQPSTVLSQYTRVTDDRQTTYYDNNRPLQRNCNVRLKIKYQNISDRDTAWIPFRETLFVRLVARRAANLTRVSEPKTIIYRIPVSAALCFSAQISLISYLHWRRTRINVTWYTLPAVMHFTIAACGAMCSWNQVTFPQFKQSTCMSILNISN